MESLAPLYKLALMVRLQMQQGESVRSALINYLNEGDSELSEDVTSLITQGSLPIKNQSVLRQSLWSLYSRGLLGEPILPSLLLIEQEIHECCEIQMQKFISSLPIKLLIPLLLLQFPAFLLLLLGPLFSNLIDSLNY
jgi:hypothetical protein